MDLALTFHVGLCLRMPKNERQSLADLEVEPLLGCWRALDEISEAFDRAEEIEDFQAIGVRCREALLTFCHAAQALIQIPETQAAPKRSDFRMWSEVIADSILSGSTHQERRALLKSCASAAWKFANWLTHAKEAHLNDAEAASSSTQLTISLFTAALIRHIRGVPDRCLACGSQRLSPERGVHSSDPDTVYERPVCEKCGWTGEAVIVKQSPHDADRAPEGECVIMTIPLRHFSRRKGKREGK